MRRLTQSLHLRRDHKTAVSLSRVSQFLKAQERGRETIMASIGLDFVIAWRIRSWSFTHHVRDELATLRRWNPSSSHWLDGRPGGTLICETNQFWEIVNNDCVIVCSRMKLERWYKRNWITYKERCSIDSYVRISPVRSFLTRRTRTCNYDS